MSYNEVIKVGPNSIGLVSCEKGTSGDELAHRENAV